MRALSAFFGTDFRSTYILHVPDVVKVVPLVPDFFSGGILALIRWLSIICSDLASSCFSATLLSNHRPDVQTPFV